MIDDNNYKLSTSEKEGILEIVITGVVTKEAIEKINTEVFEIVRQGTPKALLCDIRDATGPQNITDAYFHVREIPIDITQVPTAIVFASVSEEYKSFYETTAANVGQLVKWFEDVDEANEWLRNLIKET